MTRAEQIRFLQSLGVLPAEEAEQREDSVDYDGGVRQPAIETDPRREHDELALLIAQRASWGIGPRE